MLMFILNIIILSIKIFAYLIIIIGKEMSVRRNKT